MEVAIRPFRPDDWDGVFQLDRACFEPPYRLEYPRMRALIEDPGITVMVIEARDGDETAIVGSLMAKHEVEAGRLVLIGIMVDPGFRLAGLGRRLAGWAERIARARSVGELLAPLEAENEAGAAFLAALGFTRETGVPPFFDDPAGGNLWRRRLPAQAPAPAATTGGELPPDEASAQPVPVPSASAGESPHGPMASASRAASQPLESPSQAAQAPAPAAPQPPAEGAGPAAPQPETRAPSEPGGEPIRSAEQGVAQEPPLSAAPLQQAGAAAGTARDGVKGHAPAPTAAGPKGKARPRHAAAAKPAEPAERLSEAQKKINREAQKKVGREAQSIAGRKRKRT
ncbi:MAG: GNAT family N-acetyltransferase [SAR324 cluster bacterium]